MGLAGERGERRDGERGTGETARLRGELAEVACIIAVCVDVFVEQTESVL